MWMTLSLSKLRLGKAFATIKPKIIWKTWNVGTRQAAQPQVVVTTSSDVRSFYAPQVLFYHSNCKTPGKHASHQVGRWWFLSYFFLRHCSICWGSVFNWICILIEAADRSPWYFLRSRCPKKPTRIVSEPSIDSTRHVTESPSSQTLLGIRTSFVPFWYARVSNVLVTSQHPYYDEVRPGLQF